MKYVFPLLFVLIFVSSCGFFTNNNCVNDNICTEAERLQWFSCPDCDDYESSESLKNPVGGAGGSPIDSDEKTTVENSNQPPSYVYSTDSTESYAPLTTRPITDPLDRTTQDPSTRGISGIPSTAPNTASPLTSAVSALCGNGIVEQNGLNSVNDKGAGDDEQCDDGNTVDSDGCSSQCKVEHLLRIYLTEDSYPITQMSFGDIIEYESHLDHYCKIDPANPDERKNWRAMVGSVLRNKNVPSEWPLIAKAGYERPSGEFIGMTGSKAWFTFPLHSAITSVPGIVATGLNSQGTVSNNCGEWQDSSLTVMRGVSNMISSDSYTRNTGSCEIESRIYCVEQPLSLFVTENSYSINEFSSDDLVHDICSEEAAELGLSEFDFWPVLARSTGSYFEDNAPLHPNSLYVRGDIASKPIVGTTNAGGWFDYGQIQYPFGTSGDAVWSGFSSDGSVLSNNCNDFTSSSGTVSVSSPSASSEYLLYQGSCNGEYRLVCAQIHNYVFAEE